MQLSPLYDGPPILSIDGLGDPSVPLIRQRERLLGVLESLDDAQWAAQSRCSEWSVKDVICHLIAVDGFWAISFAAGLRGEPTKFLARFDPVKSPAQGVDGMRALAPGEVLAQFRANAEAFLDIVRDVGADQWELPAEAPPGHLALNVTALHALWDAWIHERDVMLPLGLTPAEQTDELAAILPYAAGLSPALFASRRTGRRGEFTVDATDPAIALRVEAGEQVVVRAGAGAGPRLAGRTVELIEGLSHRAPLVHDLGRDDQWLLLGLAEVFDQA